MDEQESFDSAQDKQQNAVSNEGREVNQIEPTPLSPPPSHKKLIISIVVVLVVVGLGGAYFLLQPKDQPINDVQNKSRVISSVPVSVLEYYNVTSETINFNQVDIDEKIRLGDKDITVHGFEEKTEILSSVSDTPILPEESGTKFIIVNVSVINTLPAAVNYHPGNDHILLLVDGTKVQADLAFNATYLLENSFHEGRTIEPDKLEQGVFVYEVPISAQRYDLYIPDIWTGLLYAVVLN